MKILRQDAWTKEEDAILAESTLRHIREGSTQLVAFEEVGEKLTRTPAACGFRWNSLIRKQYSSEIAEAKKDRKERYKQKRKMQNTLKDSLAYTVTIDNNNDRNQLSMEKVIEYLKQFQSTNPLIQNLENENKTLVKKVTELKKENGQLRERLENIKNEYDAVTLDYKSLLQIMDRARKLVEVPR